MRAVISAANKSKIIPSLSVVQTVPSLRKKEAPALSSPPKPKEPSSKPSTNHLKPTGTSHTCRPMSLPTRSIMLLLTKVLPIALVAGQPLRLVNKYQIATDRKWLGFIKPTLGVTIPWRSESVSLPKAIS